MNKLIKKTIGRCDDDICTSSIQVFDNYDEIKEKADKYEKIKRRLEINDSISRKEAEIIKNDFERKLLEQTNKIEQEYSKKLEDSIIQMNNLVESLKISKEPNRVPILKLNRMSSSEKYKTNKSLKQWK